MYKNNCHISSIIKGCSPLQLSCKLTGIKPADTIILILTGVDI